MTTTPGLAAHARTIENLDVVSENDLRTLADEHRPGGGPYVSVLMPTYRHGPDTLQGPIRLTGLITKAANELAAAGTPLALAEQLLAPMRAMVADAAYWQRQGDGLAIFSWADGSVDFRLPLALEEQCIVAETLRVRPLLPLLSDAGTFLILSLTQNSVRLFEGTRFGVIELDVGDTPRSMDEALAHEDHEPQVQMHTGGTGAARSHGHGVGDEIDKEALARYFRAVDRGIAANVATDQRPVVLA